MEITKIRLLIKAIDTVGGSICEVFVVRSGIGRPARFRQLPRPDGSRTCILVADGTLHQGLGTPETGLILFAIFHRLHRRCQGIDHGFITDRRNILNFMYREKKTAKQEISARLGLSLPTVSQCLKDLEEAGLIEKNGYFESTGGRKANAISFIASSKIAIGLELLQSGYEMVAINLYGDILKSHQVTREFANSPAYYEAVCSEVNRFIGTLHVAAKRILGVGIVLQGLISADGTRVTYGEILHCTGLTVETFAQYLPYPCSMIHDAEAAATDELWHQPDMQNAFFFHLRSNLSGAIIIDGKFLKGLELKSDVILGGVLARHMTAEDVDRLHEIVAKGTAFPTTRRFIRLSRCADTPIAKGAALPFVKQYLENPEAGK